MRTRYPVVPAKAGTHGHLVTLRRAVVMDPGSRSLCSLGRDDGKDSGHGSSLVSIVINRCRARASRDITVPIGTPVTLAISL